MFWPNRNGKQLLDKDVLAAKDTLAAIDAASPEFVNQCCTLARTLVARHSSRPDPRWGELLELRLAANIAFVCACEPDPAERTLETVRRIMANPEYFVRAIEVMRKSDHESVRWLGTLAGLFPPPF